jgi:hypothetical protein
MAQILVKSSRQLPCEATLGPGMNYQQQRQIEARIKVAKVVLLLLKFVRTDVESRVLYLDLAQQRNKYLL